MKLRILHFTRGNDEYIVLSEDKSIPPEDHAKPGYELAGNVEVEALSSTSGLPLEYVMQRED